MPRKRTAADTAEESRALTLPPPDVDPSTLNDVTLLETAIACTEDPKKTGRAIPATRFASSVAHCNDRTLRRYQKGTRPLLPLLREKLESLVRQTAKKQAPFKVAA